MANRKQISTARRKSVNEALRENSPPYHVNGNGRHHKLRFIDLFCGIGGFRIAFERANCECVFSSDWNKYAQQTYAINFNETPHGDIHSVAVADIPAHEILCAGFPCQPITSTRRSLTRKASCRSTVNAFFSSASRNGARLNSRHSRRSGRNLNPSLKPMSRRKPALTNQH
jgi:hypothetical protein